jgi:hypothetical protein
MFVVRFDWYGTAGHFVTDAQYWGADDVPEVRSVWMIPGTGVED